MYFLEGYNPIVPIVHLLHLFRQLFLSINNYQSGLIIGKISKIYYNKKGIKVIGDIISTPLYRIIELFGKHGKWVWEVVNGLDNRKVKEFHGERKSISKERTLFKNTDDFKEIFSKLQEINDKIHLNIVKNGIFYKTITLKIRLEGFLTYTRSKTLPNPIQDKKKVIDIILDLYKEFSTSKKKVRLVGIKLSNLEKTSSNIQTSLLNYIKN